jgi:hypothetical protein
MDDVFLVRRGRDASGTARLVGTRLNFAGSRLVRAGYGVRCVAITESIGRR